MRSAVLCDSETVCFLQSWNISLLARCPWENILTSRKTFSFSPYQQAAVCYHGKRKRLPVPWWDACRRLCNYAHQRGEVAIWRPLYVCDALGMELGLAVCGPKFTEFWGHVGDPSWLKEIFFVYLYLILFRRYSLWSLEIVVKSALDSRSSTATRSQRFVGQSSATFEYVQGTSQCIICFSFVCSEFCSGDIRAHVLS